MTADQKTSISAHPKVAEAQRLMENGGMSRREFVRTAALVGVSASAAYAMAGLSSPAHAGSTPFPADDANAKMGGKLRVAMQIQKMEDPATYSWVEMSNQTRHILEHLTFTGPDNITRPMLAEKWEASADLATWTFHLRKGVMWHNGDEFTSEDVAFNINRWLDPNLGSSNVGLSTFGAMVEEHDTGKKDDKGNPVKVKKMIPGALEIVDKYTVKLNLKKPVLSVPEDLYNYPTAIVHRGFKAPLSANVNGTGPFTLTELKVGKHCLLKRVTKDGKGKDFNYWGGKVYLDEIAYYNFDEDNQLTAFASGDVDGIYEFGIEQLELAKALPNGNILAAKTAQTLVCRMQISQKPFDNKKLRQALMHGLDTSAFNDLVFQGLGTEAEHHHVAPIHPEYYPLPKVKRDVAKAKALLKEAGHGDGVELTIDVGNTDGPWHQSVAEVMRDQLADIGVKLKINVMPPSKYWEIWDKTPFGATAWTHRPLGTMVLSLGYRAGVPWNETHLANPDFDKALDVAEATFDVAERKEKMKVVESIMQDEAVILQPLWRPVFTIVSKKVHGYPPHPTQYHQFNKIWIG